MASDSVEELQEQCRLGARFLWTELRDLYGHVSCRLLYLEQAAEQQIWASAVGIPEVLPEPPREYHARVGWSGASFLWHQLAWEGQNR